MKVLQGSASVYNSITVLGKVAIMQFIYFLVFIHLGIFLPVSAEKIYQTNTGSKLLDFKLREPVIANKAKLQSQNKLIKLASLDGKTKFQLGREIVVELQKAQDLSKLTAYLKRTYIRNMFNAKIIREFSFDSSFALLELAELNLDKLLELNQRLNKLDFVKNSELNMYRDYKLSALDQFIPNDPLFINQWHLNNNAQFSGAKFDADIDAAEAWVFTKGRGVRVAVLDAGFEINHPELATSVVAQLDILDGDNDASNASSNESHGTNVAGLLAAIQGNGRGLSGVSPEVELILVRVTDSNTFPKDSALAEAFEFAIANGADVITNSYALIDNSGVLEPSPIIAAAVKFAQKKGRGGKGSPVLFASGNNGVNLEINDLATIDDVIVVGAVGDQDQIANYSNFGEQLSVVGPSSSRNRPSITTLALRGGLTNSFSGTSAACPIVAGVYALALSVNPELSRKQVQALVENTADKVGGPYDENGHSVFYGFGRVNALNAVSAAIKQGLKSEKTKKRVKKLASLDIEKSLYGNSSASISNNPEDFDRSLELDESFFRLTRKKSKTKKLSITVTDPHGFLLEAKRAYVFSPSAKSLKVRLKKITNNDGDQKQIKLSFKIKASVPGGIGLVVLTNRANTVLFAGEIVFQ